eukprot:5849891-Heterocapsa_arctica.AAC.1
MLCTCEEYRKIWVYYANTARLPGVYPSVPDVYSRNRLGEGVDQQVEEDEEFGEGVAEQEVVVCRSYLVAIPVRYARAALNRALTQTFV